TCVLGCHDIGPLPPSRSGRAKKSAAADEDSGVAGASGGAAGQRAMDDQDDASGAEPSGPLFTCNRLDSKEPMPPGDVVAAGDAAPQMQAVFTRDVFGLFKSACGACHVESIRAGFQVKSLATFAESTKDRQQRILDKIRSDDETSFMPPA